MKFFKNLYVLFFMILLAGGFGCDSGGNNGGVWLGAKPFSFSWAANIGSTNSDTVYAIETDSAGNIFYTGTFNGSGDPVDFDPTDGTDTQSGASSYDMFLTKLNADGTYGWTKVIAGADYEQGSCIAFDSNGNIYVGGTFSGTDVDFDPATGTDDLKSTYGSNQRDVYVTKFNASGTYVNTIIFDYTGTVSNICNSIGGIAVDSSDNLYVTGGFEGPVDFDPTAGEDSKTNSSSDIYITRINANGSYGWTKTIGGSDDEYSRTIGRDSSDNIYISGTFEGTVDFDFGAAEDSKASVDGSSDIFITKIQADGAYVWTKTMGGDEYDSPKDLAIDSSNNILVTGSFRGTVDFDPGDGTDEKTSVATTTWNTFVTKINSDGTYGWTGTFTEVNRVDGNSIAVDGSGNAYVTGKFTTNDTYPTVDFDPDETGTTDDIHSLGNTSDVYLTKLNSDGTYGWTETFGGSTGDDYGQSVAVHGSKIYLTGRFFDSGDFNPGDEVEELNANNDTWDIFIVAGSI